MFLSALIMLIRLCKAPVYLFCCFTPFKCTSVLHSSRNSIVSFISSVQGGIILNIVRIKWQLFSGRFNYTLVMEAYSKVCGEFRESQFSHFSPNFFAPKICIIITSPSFQSFPNPFSFPAFKFHYTKDFPGRYKGNQTIGYFLDLTLSDFLCIFLENHLL